MLKKLRWLYNIYKNQGASYVIYRSYYELARKKGLLRRKFPTDSTRVKFITLEKWRSAKPAFFFDNKASVQMSKKTNDLLARKYENFLNNRILYFNESYVDRGSWLSNADTGHLYSLVHWTEIEDFDKAAGDIKYVWEKSRFSFLLDLIRYDYHFGQDCGELVLSTIENWIDSNPINSGPNYKCSQEISIRVLHWTFALYYFSDHHALTEERFQKMMHAIYWQLHHVRNNIHFSRTCVRNNHAVTEVMMLYFSGLLFPFMPGTAKWKVSGKKWLEEEIEYQVYPDGTYLQFSHNYQRVLMQLLTWCLVMSDLHHEKMSDTFITRTKSVVNYIRSVIDTQTGFLPNYGANDGALFFRLNDNVYRDYRPQLNALYYALYAKHLYPEQQEDIQWLNTKSIVTSKTEDNFELSAIKSFPEGGIYTIRDNESFTFIKCASYKDRPSHADNLHVDIWWHGQNVLRDAGTYKYNTSAELTEYFSGTRSHNTVTLGDYDQMKKGERFIWYDWSEAGYAKLEFADTYYRFEGDIIAFKHLGKGIRHKRTVLKKHNASEWTIIDEITGSSGQPLRQWWHPMPRFSDHFSISAINENGGEIMAHYTAGYYSPNYGVLEAAQDICFETSGNKITTHIKVLSKNLAN